MRPSNLNPNWKGGKPSYICVVCGIQYFTYNKPETTTCCSRKCASRRAMDKVYGEGYKAKPKQKSQRAKYTKLLPAKICGHYTKKGRSYCRTCTPYFAEFFVSCKICRKPIKVFRSSVSKISTCSRECLSEYRSLYQKGNKSHRWLGGKTSRDIIARGSKEYSVWRKAVFVRDQFTCQICGSLGGRLCADHIKPWCLYPSLRFDIDNGRTLCYPCHSKLETTGSRMTNIIYREKVKNGGVQYRMF